MRQDIALKILKENRQALADEYDIENIGVFPYEENSSANCKCECGRCGGYHPDIKIGVAVEYKPDAKPGMFNFVSLERRIAEIFRCDILLEMIGGHKDDRYKQTDDYLQDVVYVEWGRAATP